MRWTVPAEWTETRVRADGVLPISLARFIADGLAEIHEDAYADDLYVAALRRRVEVCLDDRLGRLSARGSPTPMWVLGRQIRCVRGFWGKRGWTWGNTADLATPAGMAAIAHECLHVVDWIRGRLDTVAGLWLPWVAAGITGQVGHRTIQMELDAIDIETDLVRHWAR